MGSGLHDRLARARAKAAGAAAAAARLAGRVPARVAAPLAGALLAALVAAGFGARWERRLFAWPVHQAARRLLGAAAVPDDLRFVLLDDASLRKIGRHPTFAEWREVAEILFGLGYEKVILGAIFTAEDEIGALSPTPAAAGELFTGVAVYRSYRAVAAVPGRDPAAAARRQQRFDNAAATGEFTLANVLGLEPAVVDASSAVGHLNVDNDDEGIALSFSLGTDAALPYLGLFAADGLRSAGAGLADVAGPLPRPYDGRVFGRPLELDAINAKALPASAFYAKAAHKVSPKLGAAAREKLAGGRVAVLVPNAHTGGGQVETALGTYPAFATLAAAAASARKHDLVYAAVPPRRVLLGGVLLAFLVASRRRVRVALAALLFGLLALVAAAAWALSGPGLLLPGFGLTLIAAGAGGARFLAHLFGVFVERVAAQKDLELGRAVQSVILPRERRFETASYELRFRFEPFGAMSGDWFQCWVAPPGADVEAVAAIGDVVGKGPSAALITTAVKIVWNEHVGRWNRGAVDAHALLVELDRAVRGAFLGTQNSSVSLAVLLRDSVVIACCGAPFWLEIGVDGSVTRWRHRPVNPMGYADGKVHVLERPLRDGHGLLAVTDGVMDGTAAHMAFSELIAARGGGLAPEAVIAAAMAAGEKTSLPDDKTVLYVVRRRGGAAGAGESGDADGALRDAG